MKLSWLSRSLINQWYRLQTKEVEDLHLDLTPEERALCFDNWRLIEGVEWFEGPRTP